MVETAVIAFLSSLGVVLLFGILTGRRLLPVQGEGFCVIYADDRSDPEAQIRAVRFLRFCGLLRLPLYVVDHTSEGALEAVFSKEDGTRFFQPREWEEYIKTEREHRACGK